MKSSRNVILYIAMSLDGYIATPDEDLSFLSIVQQEGEDYGYSDFMESIDTVILGRKTYDWVMKHVDVFPHAGQETYVITRTPRASIDKTCFYTGNLKALVSRLKNVKGKNIFIDGGAQVVNALLSYDLIDAFYISVIPVLLGKGIKLFQTGYPELRLKLMGAHSFEKGLVQLHYVRDGRV